MKKSATIFLILLAFGIAGVKNASAQKIPYYAGISAMYALENIDTAKTQEKFSGPVTIDFANAWGIQLRGGYVFNKYVTAEALGEYVTSFVAKTGADRIRLDAASLTLNAKLTWPVFKNIIPYAVAGAGLISAHEDIEFGGATSKTSSHGPVVRGGAGLDINLTKSLVLNLEGAYVSGVNKVKHIRYSNVSLGFNYRF